MLASKTRKLLALLLSLTMCVSLLGTAASAVEGDGEGEQHLAGCGYQCTHTEHDDSCGYVAAVEEVPCGHIHDENCGWSEETPDGCTHDHDDTCGYQEATSGSPCTHNCADAGCPWVCVEGCPLNAGSGEEEPDPSAPVGTNVAMIGEVGYATLDEALSAAAGMTGPVTITLLADCEINGMTVENKDLTIQGADGSKPVITFQNLGIYANGSNLTLENCEIVMTISENPSKNGGTANLLTNTDLTLNGVVWTLTNDHADATGESGLFLYQDSNLYIQNGSQVKVSGFNDPAETEDRGSSGIYADNSEYAGQPNREIVISGGSSLEVSGCGWNGMTIDPVDVTVTGGSTLELTKNGTDTNGQHQGGLGSYNGTLTITEGSTVTANQNTGTGWGVSVKGLVIDGTSTLNACENAGVGLQMLGEGTIGEGATVNLNQNSSSGLWVYRDSEWVGALTIETGAKVSICENGRYGINNANVLDVKSGATVLIQNNAGTGIWNYDGSDTDDHDSSITVEANANVTITGNQNGGIYNDGFLTMASGTITNNTKNGNGGGLNNGMTAILSDAVAIYNNHATSRGDDICHNVWYADKSELTFYSVGNGWVLDDCNHAITGWFIDNTNARWDADAEAEHVEEYNSFDAETGAVTITSAISLKAAHGLVYEVTYDLNGGQTADGSTTVAAQEYPVNAGVTVLANPTRSGYTFQGWTITTDNESVSAPVVTNGTFTMPGANVHLVANWVSNYVPPITPVEPTPTPDPDPDPSEPTEEIPDEDVPQGELPEQPGDPGTQPENPEETVIDEEEPPMADAPETGDNLALWVTATSLSGLGLIALAVTGRKRKEQEN